MTRRRGRSRGDSGMVVVGASRIASAARNSASAMPTLAPAVADRRHWSIAAGIIFRRGVLQLGLQRLVEFRGDELGIDRRTAGRGIGGDDADRVHAEFDEVERIALLHGREPVCSRTGS